MGNGPDARARYMPASQFILDGYFEEWSGDAVRLTVPHVGADTWLGPGDLSDNDVPLTAQQQTQVNHNPNFQFQMPATFGNLILE